MKRLAIILGMAAMMRFLAAGSAQATSITGDISFSGSMEAYTSNGGTLNSNFQDDTYLTFSNVFVGDSSEESGDYVGTAGDAVTTFNPITYNSTEVTDASGNELWSFTEGSVTYSFDLTSASVNYLSSTDIVLQGTGTLNITGYTATTGSFSLTANSSGPSFTFSGGDSAVPEPATLLLLGAGMIGLGIFSSRRKKV